MRLKVTPGPPGRRVELGFGNRSRRTPNLPAGGGFPPTSGTRPWLYVAYDCGTPNPRLVRVQDPFGNLLAKAKGSVLISPVRVIEAAVE